MSPTGTSTRSPTRTLPMATLNDLRYRSENRAAGATEPKTGALFCSLNFALSTMTPSCSRKLVKITLPDPDLVQSAGGLFRTPLDTLRCPARTSSWGVGSLGKDHDLSEGISAIAPLVNQVHPCLVADRMPAGSSARPSPQPDQLRRASPTQYR